MTIAAIRDSVIRSGLDASPYKGGAKQVEAANAGMVASGEKVVVAQEKVTRSLVQGAGAAERLQRSLDPAYSATRKFEQAQTAATRAVERGHLTQARANELIDLASRKFLTAGTAAEQAATGIGRFGAAGTAAAGAVEGMSSRLGSLGTFLTGLGPIGIAAGIALGTVAAALVPIAQAGDEARATLARLAAATGGMDSARAAFEGLYQISRQTGVSVSETAGSFQRFRIAAGEIGATNSQVLRLVEGLQKASVVSGVAASEGAAATMQLAQALASGRLNGDELRSLLENMPALAVKLAAELGTNVGQLRQLGEEGKLTADKVFPALLRASEKMSAEFDKMPLTMGRAFGVLGVEMTAFAARLDEVLGVSEAVARAVKAAADAVRNVRQTVAPTPLEKADQQIAGATRERDLLAARLKEAEADIAMYQGQGLSRAQAIDLAVPALPGAKSLGAQWAEAEQALRAGLQARFEILAEAAERENREAEAAARKQGEAYRAGIVAQVKEAREALDQLPNEKVQRQIDALRVVVDAGGQAFAKYGVSANDAAAMLDVLQQKVSPLAKVLAGLNDELNQAIAANVSPLEARVAQAQAQAKTPGVQQTPEELNTIRTAVTGVEAEKQRGVAAEAERQAEIAKRILEARRSGNAMAVKLIEIEEKVRQARDRGASAADQERIRTAEITKAQAELAASQIKSLTPIADVRRELTEAAAAAEHQAAASGLSAAAQARAALQDKARAAALKVARDGTAAYAKAYAEFLGLVERGARAQATEDFNRRAATLRDELALLEREMELVGALPVEREKELAVLRLRQELLASGKQYSEDEIRSLEELTRKRIDSAAALRQMQGSVDAVANGLIQAFDRAGDALTQVWAGGEGAVVRWGNVARATAASVGNMLVRLGGVTPITNALFNRTDPTLWGALGGASGAGAGSGGGGIMDFLGLGQLLGGKSIGEALGLTGSGGLFSSINTSLFGTAGVPAASYADLGGITTAGTPGTPGLFGTYGSAGLTGVLSAAGLGFGAGSLLNSMLNRSPAQSTNGMIGAGAGSLAGVGAGLALDLAFPGMGTLVSILGGLAGGGLGGLIGPKASVQGYGYALRGNEQGLLTMSNQFYNDSGKAAFEEAATAIAALNDYLGRMGVTISGAVGVGGNKNGADYSNAAAGSYAEGVSKLWYGAKDPELDFAIADKRGRRFADAGEMQKFVDGFYAAKSAIEALTAEPVPEFTAQINAVAATFDAALAQAREYGLAEEKLTAARAKALAELEAQRSEYLHQVDVSLNVRRLRAEGRTLEADLAQQAEEAAQQLKAAGTELDRWAVSAEEKARRLVELEEVQAAERAKIIADYGQQAVQALLQAGGSIRGYLDGLATGTGAGQTAEARLAAAREQFTRDRTLGMGSDADALGRITSTADALLAAGRDTYGTATPEFAALRQEVISGLSKLPVVKGYDARQADALEAIQKALEQGTLTTVISPAGNVVTIAGGSLSLGGVEAGLAAVNTTLGYVVDTVNATSVLERTVLGWIVDGLNAQGAQDRTVMGWIVDTINGTSALDRAATGHVVDTLVAGFTTAATYQQQHSLYLAAANDNLMAGSRVAADAANASTASLAAMNRILVDSSAASTGLLVNLVQLGERTSGFAGELAGGLAVANNWLATLRNHAVEQVQRLEAGARIAVDASAAMTASQAATNRILADASAANTNSLAALNHISVDNGAALISVQSAMLAEVRNLSAQVVALQKEVVALRAVAKEGADRQVDAVNHASDANVEAQAKTRKPLERMAVKVA